MLTLLLLVFVIILGYISGYIVSLFAKAVYLDPNEIKPLIPKSATMRLSILKKLSDDPRALIQIATVYRSLVLIIITGAAIFLTSQVLNYPDTIWGYPLILIIIWIFHLSFVEYGPRFAMRREIDSRIFKYLWFISVLYVLFSPVLRIYHAALKRAIADNKVTEEDKEEIVERAIESLAEQVGIDEVIVEEDEKEMIGHIFQLDQTLVREIMSPRTDMVAIEKLTSFQVIVDLVRNDGHSRYPVYEKSIDKILGLLYVKDLFSNMPKPGEEFVISNYLRPPFFVPETKIIRELQREFLSRKLHVAIVVDEFGGVSGLVTLEDILEEIVGEIQDEHDTELEDIRELANGLLLVAGSVRIEKLQEYLKTDYNHDESDTVGGIIYDLVGSVPQEGAKVKWNDIQLEVSKVEGQRIISVLVRLLTAPPHTP